MKAFQYESPEVGLQLRDVPIPEPGEGQVLLEVRGAGICHSDCHIVSGEGDSWIAKKPMTLGHEASGFIKKLGAGVTDFEVGERVAASHVCHPVEEQDFPLMVGLGCDGGYAQYMAAPVSRLVRLPDEVSFAQAAVATDALAGSYHAVVGEGGARPGITMGILGIGGLGMAGLGYAILKGATVYGFDIAEERFAEARRLGAVACFKSLEEARDVKLDVIVDFVGSSTTVPRAIASVKKGGRVVVMGLASETIPLSIRGDEGFIMRSVTLVGALGASLQDLIDVIELMRQGKTHPLLVEVPFENIPASLDALAKGGVTGRLWADPNKAPA